MAKAELKIKDLVCLKLASDWKDLGLQLNVPLDTLNTIQSTNASQPKMSKSCLRDMFDWWKQNVDDATVEALIQALINIERKDVARSLCEQHGIETPPSLKREQSASSFSSSGENGEASHLLTQSQPRDSASLLISEPSTEGISLETTDNGSGSEGGEHSESQLQTASTTTCSSIQPNNEEQPSGCSCGRCTFDTYVIEGCPKPTTTKSSFPYLDITELDENGRQALQGKLHNEFQEISRKFSSLFLSTFSSMEEQKVSIPRLQIVLMSFPTFHPTKQSNLPLLGERVDKIKAANSYLDLFWIVNDYVSFHDHFLIDHIIKELGTEEDRKKLESYKKELDEYCKRSIYECPAFSNSRDDQVNLVMKVADDMKNYDLNNLASFRLRVSKIIQVKKHTFRLVKIEPGCVQLTYQIPHFVKKVIFPLSVSQIKALQAEGVIRLYCGDYHIACDYDTEVKISQLPQSIPEKLPQLHMETEEKALIPVKHTLHQASSIGGSRKCSHYCIICGKGDHLARNCLKRVPSEYQPLFQLNSSQSVAPEVHELLQKTLHAFGHQEFRYGQEQVIIKILHGISTLAVLPRNSGKSLCYQLPAYLYHQRSKSIGLVISPLISLMEEQISNQLPACIKAVCLHHQQSLRDREKALKSIMDKKVHLVFMSPEELMNRVYDFDLYPLHYFPPIAFVCIDEVHCVSDDWSRCAYIRLSKVLMDRIGAECILGLSATAAESTSLSLANDLGIAKENIIYQFDVPINLKITASFVDNSKAQQIQALAGVLQSEILRDLDSFIIYCTKKADTEDIALQLQTLLHPSGSISDSERESTSERKQKLGKRKSSGTSGKAAKIQKRWSVAYYHAGMIPSERKEVLQDFITGKLRVVVATVALGMGLNNFNVQTIIHFNIPKSFELYMQQINRAGRDGRRAYCHVFIRKDDRDASFFRWLLKKSTPKQETIEKVRARIQKRLANELQKSKECIIVQESLDVQAELSVTELLELYMHPGGIQGKSLFPSIIKQEWPSIMEQDDSFAPSGIKQESHKEPSSSTSMEQASPFPRMRSFPIIKPQRYVQYSPSYSKEQDLGIKPPIIDVKRKELFTLLCCLEEVGNFEIISPLNDDLDSIHIKCSQEFCAEDLYTTAQVQQAYMRLKKYEDSQITNLNELHKTLKGVACYSFSECFQEDSAATIRQNGIIKALQSYFCDKQEVLLPASLKAPTSRILRLKDDDCDLSSVSSYLVELDKEHIYQLGVRLGLGWRKLRVLKESSGFLEHMVASWLNREDRVQEKGPPSWKTLVNALKDKKVGQFMIADRISGDKLY